MRSEETRKNQWLLAALFAPVAHFSGCGWLAAGLTALAVLPLTLLPKRWEGMSRPAALVQILWLGVAAGRFLGESAVYWPSDNDLAVPLTILALALWAKTTGPRIGAVLAFCIALLSIPLAASGASHLKPGWLAPRMGPWSPGLTAALLLPALPVAGEDGKGKALTAGILTLASSALVQGVISLPVAARAGDAFYQTARTLGYLEPVAAVAMTLGWFAVALFLLGAAEKIGKNCAMGRAGASVLAAGTAAGVLLWGRELSNGIFAVFCLFFWIIHPILRKNKKSAKNEK